MIIAQDISINNVSEEVFSLVDINDKHIYNFTSEKRAELKVKCQDILSGDYTDLEKSVADTLYGNIVAYEDFLYKESQFFELRELENHQNEENFDKDYYESLYKEVWGTT